MRIISGYLKGRMFNPPRTFKARPTTDFAKENLFNVLNFRIDWTDVNAIDFFAGTGSISYELISRGCKTVTAVEKDVVHAKFIKEVKRDLKMENLMVYQSDFFKMLSKIDQTYDFIFADPPYSLSDFEKIPQLILDSGCLKKGGLFVLEHSSDYDFSKNLLFVEKRKYGSVNFSFFAE